MSIFSFKFSEGIMTNRKIDMGKTTNRKNKIGKNKKEKVFHK